jgi:transcriptional regulator with XRE-family HTH domain
MSEGKEFGKWLRQRRKDRGLTQEEFGDRIGYSWEMVRKIEEGKRNPSKQVAELIAEMFGVPVEERAEFLLFARGLSRSDNGHGEAAEALAVALAQARGHAPNNLFQWRTSFVGRADDLALVRDLLLRDDDVRLLTLTGPPGIGKSRLSLEVAASMLDNPRFKDGIYLVGLSALTDPALVLPAITQTLGVKEVPNQPRMELLKDYLR